MRTPSLASGVRARALRVLTNKARVYPASAIATAQPPPRVHRLSLHLFSNLFSSIDFAATTSASVSSSFNLDSREDVKAHMSVLFTQKDHPALQKNEIVHEKICLFLLKKTSQPRKKLKFCMKKQKSAKKGTKKSTHPRITYKRFIRIEDPKFASSFHFISFHSFHNK